MLINRYFLSSIIVACCILFLAFWLRLQPIYTLTKVVIPALSAKNKVNCYSQKYITILKDNYANADCDQDDTLCSEKWKQMPSYSVFQFSLQQVIYSSSKAVSSWPIVTAEQNENLTARFRICEKEDFEVCIYFVKKDNKYLFDKIENFSKLLKYHPEYLNAFKQVDSFK